MKKNLKKNIQKIEKKIDLREILLQEILEKGISFQIKQTELKSVENCRSFQICDTNLQKKLFSVIMHARYGNALILTRLKIVKKSLKIVKI